MTVTTIGDAALARAAGMAQRSHRPTQRRCAEFASSAARTAPVRLRSISLREASDAATVEFTGVASATEQGYEMYDAYGPYTEVVTRGAFGRTLASADLDVPLVLGHDQMRRIARTTNGTLQLAETNDGLVPIATLDMRDADVAYIVPKMRAGLIDEMSFAFRITSGSWSPDYSEFRINEVDLQRGDVAIVGYGANPNTSATLRAQIGARLQESRALDAEDVNMLTQALGWFTALDSIVDEAQEALAGYLKVPSPDPDDSEGGARSARPRGMSVATLNTFLD